jgi:hypothetical protein
MILLNKFHLVELLVLHLRPSKVRENLIVIECVFDVEGNFHVGGSITRSGFKLGHFDQIHLYDSVEQVPSGGVTATSLIHGL